MSAAGSGSRSVAPAGCWGQHRSTQRRIPLGHDDEDRLVADMLELARRYGRYGLSPDRRPAARRRLAGQPKRGRLWLNDGSCVRLRPERADHVWSYDFVHHRTDDARAFRTRNILDEFTRESLAIRVRRKLSSVDVIDVLTALFILRAIPGLHPLRQRPEVRRRGRPAMDRRGRRPDRLHRTGFALGERLHRELQRTAARRAPERGDLLHPEGSPGSH